MIDDLAFLIPWLAVILIAVSSLFVGGTICAMKSYLSSFKEKVLHIHYGHSRSASRGGDDIDRVS